MNLKLTEQEFFNSFELLKNYCEKNNYIGWDPFDGLNSRLFRFLQLHRSKFMRLAIIQFNKNCPLNFRPLFLIPKGENPKGLALFLSAYCNLYKLEPNINYLEIIKQLSQKIIQLKSKGYNGSCWGYNFDWQSRAFFLPKYTPTIVATSFVVYSLLDSYEITKDENILNEAISSKDFVFKDLNKIKYNNSIFLSYSPLDNSVVYNASLLGTRLLARIYSFTKEKDLYELAHEVVKSCVKEQNDNGSWVYGKMKIQNWIDSFHTGYNLESLFYYQKYTGDYSFQNAFLKGLEFYRNNFFTNDHLPKYYHNSLYPIEPHSLAEYIRVMVVTNNFKTEKEKIDNALSWLIKNMQSKNGYFYFRKLKHYKIKIPYMRWVQAWMFNALSYYLIAQKNESNM